MCEAVGRERVAGAWTRGRAGGGIGEAVGGEGVAGGGSGGGGGGGRQPPGRATTVSVKSPTRSTCATASAWEGEIANNDEPPPMAVNRRPAPPCNSSRG